MLTLHLIKLMGWSLSRLALLVPFAICLACLAISPQAGAALPPQDGEYVNQNTAEGEDALFSLHPITKAVIDTVAGATFAQSVSQPFARTITESATLTASDAARQDYFGISVSLQGDQALVGGLDTGSAYVFAFDGTTWSQQAILVSSDHEVLDEFGYSVSLSGNRALVGAPLGSDAGAAYVFVFDGTSWQQEAKLMASDSETSDAFGYSVSLSGNRALIGTNRSNKSGIAYTFVFDGTTWNQETELIPVDSAVNDGFGKSVSLSGQRALVGSPGAVFSAIGSAYVFAFDGATWNQESKLTASDGSLNDHFGTAVSISGRRALVGASHHATQETGAAYTFVLTGGSWIQEAKLAASDGIANDDFGTSVSLMGKHALIGADDYINGQAGSAYVFTFNGTAWNEQVKLLDSHGAPDDSFGASVSLSGTRVLAGAPQDNVNGGRDVGSALIFDLARRP